MARGNDESNNPRRRPQRPQTDEEKMAIVKQVFPDAKEVDPDYAEDDFPKGSPEWEESVRWEKRGTDENFAMADSYYRSAMDAAEKESFGDDYNAYKAHKAGDTDGYEEGQDPDDPYDKGKKKDPYDKD